MRGYPVALATLTLFALLLPTAASAQVVTPPRFGSNLDVTRSRIGDERVQRQTEVSRLEGLVETLSDKVIRLERHQLRSAQLPAISIAEALATLDFAKAQLKETEYQLERGEASEVQFARDRLALVRAQGQLESAKASYEERLVILELDVLHAENELFQLSREKELTKKFVAKGYTTSDHLRRLLMSEKLLEKELQLLKLRLQTQKRTAGQESTFSSLSSDLTSESTESTDLTSGEDAEQGRGDEVPQAN